MASRYDDWRRVRGDTDDPALVALGHKMLGYLAEQRKLGGVKSQLITRRLPDGSVIRAQFVRDQPLIEIQTKSRGTTGPDTFLAGLVAEPRTFGSYTAFGPFSETILAPHGIGTDHEAWESYFYDATYGSGGQYKRTLQGKPLFADGLTLGGNLDWRSQDENISVNWFGPTSRYFPENGHFGNWVFRNGEIIFDAQNLPQFDTNIRTLVISAAIRKPGTLLVCTYEKVFTGGGLHHYIRFYRAALHASTTHDTWFGATGLPVYQAPRMDPVDTAGMLLLGDPDLVDTTPCVRIAEIEIPELSGYLYVTPFHFNQSATEARAILPLWQASPVATVVTEFAVNLSDLDDVIVSRNSLGTISETETVTTTYADVLLNVGEYPFFHWTDPTDFSTPNGTYPCDDPAAMEGGTPFYGASGTSGTDICEIPLNTVVTKVTTNTDLEYPIAVDYQDDVPVYAYMKARDISATTTRNSTATYSSTNSGSGEVVVTGFGTLGVTRTFNFAADATEDAGANVTETYASAGVMPGLRCPRRLASGDWLDVQGGTSATGALTASSSLSATGTRSGSVASAPGGPAPVADNWPTMNGGCTFDSDWTWSESSEMLSVWFLDLRYEAAIYTLTTQVQSAHKTETFTTDVTTSIGNTMKYQATPTSPLPITTTFEVTRDRSYDTRVVFNGTQVASWLGSTAGTDTITSTTPASVLQWQANSQDLGWRALNVFSPNYPHSRLQTYTLGQPVNTALTFLEAWDGSGPFPVHADDYPSDTDITRWVADDGFLLDVAGGMGAAGVAGITWPYSDGSGNYRGRYQAYRGGWCYSTPKMSGTVTSTPLFDVRISSGESVDMLTGAHGLEMLGALWPLSRCVFLTSKG